MSKITEISGEDAVRIFYYLMAVDGKISQEEEEKFEIIAKELDSYFELHKERIISSCQEQLSKTIDEEDYYDVIQEGVGDVLDSYVSNNYMFPGEISNRIVVWNLLVIAISDGRYANQERKLIKYVVRRMDVEKSVFEEMENAIRALDALEKQKTWVKTTNKSYLVIETLVNELENRRNVIKGSIEELMIV